MSNKNNDLTVAICVYNAEEYIEGTLKCIVEQTMQDFHLLILNDCSTDNSAEVIEKFFQIHPRQYEQINFEVNQGIAYARDFAINHVNSKYFLFVDADDLLSKNLIRKEYDLILSDEDLMGVSCWSKYINNEGEKIYGGIYLGETEKEGFIEKARQSKLNFLPIQTMFDREIAVKAGGFATKGFPSGKPRYQDFCEDLDLWTRMSDYYTCGKVFITIPEVLYYYRKGGGLSSNYFNMAIKMRYTKTNLLARRNANPEKTFVEFYESLSSNDIKKIRSGAIAAESFKKSILYLKQLHLGKAIYQFVRSIYNEPFYIISKLKYNLKVNK